MKKLISVFAALAFVGSMAAAPKKPAAKPVVAAPAAAAPVAAVAASMPKSSGKGIGLSIEGRGSYTLAGGTSSAYGNSGSQTDGANTAITYALSNSYAVGGGATIAYEIMSNLGITLGFDYRSFTTREWKGPVNASPWSGILRDLAGSTTIGAVAAATCGNTAACGASGYADFGKSTSNIYKADSTTKTTWKNMVLTLGLRPSVNALGGRFYAGGGLALVLPYNQTTDVTFSNKASLSTAILAAMPDSGTQTDKFNLGIGAFGELGYNYDITDNVFAGIGIRVIMATSDNKGLTRELSAVKPDGSTIKATVDVADSVTETEKTLTTADGGKTYTAKTPYSSNGITDVSANVVVGVRF